MELSKNEAWFLEVTALEGLPISLLFDKDWFQNEMNLPYPQIPSEEVLQILEGLCKRGWLRYETSDGENLVPSPATELRERVRRYQAIRHTQAEIDFEARYDACGFVSITAAGGQQWEEYAEPQWEMVLLVAFGALGDAPWTIQAQSKECIQSYIDKAGYQSVPGTEVWNEMQPWKPVGWKSLESGWALQAQLQQVVTDPFLAALSVREISGLIGSRDWYKNSVVLNR